ncbi:MAG: response regulator [Thermodesulfobacteriota bacterium]
MRMLIVEDEKVSRKKMRIILEEFGVCDETASGSEALAMFRKAWEERAPYDIVTLDITLHEMNGAEVLLQMRQFEQERNLPKAKLAKIIMVTSHSDVDHITTCITAGCNSYTVKPFTRESIRKCLRAVYAKTFQEIFG